MKNRTTNGPVGQLLSKKKKARPKSPARGSKKVNVSPVDPVFGSKTKLISDTKSALKLVLRRNELLRLASQVAKLGYFELNRNTMQMKWSSQLLEIFEVEKGCEPLIGKPKCNWIFKEDYGAVLKAFKDAASGIYNPVSYRIRTPSGTKWLRTTFSGMDTVNKELVFGTTQDITNVKEIEQMIANAIAEAEIRERNRIAADLHDGVCQHLATIHLSIDTAQKMIRDQDPEALHFMSEIKDLASETLSIARKVSHDLMPVDLLNSGFLKGIKAVVSRLNRAGKIKYTVNVWGKEKKMQANVSNNLYRVVQEFIHNSEKHAEATEVNIHIKYQQGSLELTIADNGKGFDPDKVRKLRGIGLESMFNRIRSFTTSYEYKAREGKGVSLYISVPL